jgi:hypothetical protein
VSTTSTRTIVRYAAAYGVWALTAALGIALIWVWRSALLALFVRLRLDKYAYAAYNNVVVLGLVLAWLVLVVASETWCRQAAERGHLRRLIVRLGGVLVVLITIGYAAFRVLG